MNQFIMNLLGIGAAGLLIIAVIRVWRRRTLRHIRRGFRCAWTVCKAEATMRSEAAAAWEHVREIDALWTAIGEEQFVYEEDWEEQVDDELLAELEACDPVEDDVYDITTKSGVKVSVSNFVLPAWFDPRAPEGAKLDFMAKLTKPFTTSTGGYFVMRHPKTGETKNIYGSSNAASMHAMRQAPHPAARSTRKIST